MSEISMNIVIHRAVRRDLRRFEQALAGLKPGDRERGAQIARAWSQLDDQLTHHHEGEHKIAFPTFAAVGVDQALIATMETEHHAMADALDGARGAFATLGTSVDAAHIEAAQTARGAVETATTRHLDHEESALEPIYQDKKGTAEVKTMSKRFSREMGLARAGRFFAWLTDGAGPEELATIDREVPKPVRVVVGGLFGRGYRRDIEPLWATLR
jgi:hemerythrin-like domain-containing protein